MKFLRNNFSRNSATGAYDGLVDTFIATQESLHTLPQLSPDEKVSFEQEIAIGHLYHSSKIEGTNLNTERLQKAIAVND